jgi:NAD(P)-dependent dehydrogenase (short-subunit alcohol dehydrogenase family)
MSASRRFIGKVAFVTGAASGIGRATAVAFAGAFDFSNAVIIAGS